MGVTERREREREARRTAILVSAKDLFSRKGFHSTTIDDIAEKAEIGKGTVYNYFASKQEILGYLLLSNMQMAVNWFDAIMTEIDGKEPMDRLSTLAGTFMRYVMEQVHPSNTFYIILGDFAVSDLSEGLKQELRETVEALFKHVRRIFEDGVESGLFRKDINPEKMALILWGAAIGVHALSRKLSPDVLPDFTEDVYRELLKLIPGGVGLHASTQ